MNVHASTDIPARRIFDLWWPLAASSLLMSAEMPFVNAGIARTANADVALAGFGLAATLAILTEAPVILLNSATAALAKDRATFDLLSRFAFHLIFFVTAVHFLLSFTPLYDVVLRQWMGVPDAVADACLPALRILILWPAPIGWRRSRQGLIIRLRRTHLIGAGTVVRLCFTVGLTLLTIGVLGWPGQIGGAAAVGTAVLIEAAVITFWAGRLLVDVPTAPAPAMSYSQLLQFYLPLVVVSLLSILAQPILSTGLARAPFPTESLAAWPTLWGLASLMASFCQPMQETTVTFAERHGALGSIRRFGMVLGLGASAVLALLAFTPLADFYFGRMIGLSDHLRGYTNQAIALMVPYPFLMSCEVMLRGFLIKQHQTAAARLAMACYVLVLGVTLAAGVTLQLGTGVQIAAGAVLLAITSEVALLAWQARPVLLAMRANPATA
ncbi:MAG: hypothetical protein HZB53_19275 [Chloroflexi bacterium]|nr:hypothetical protein [Chloroflexota bacterium]